jgi:hypothetical protein
MAATATATAVVRTGRHRVVEVPDVDVEARACM